ncbi:hypothetical protein ADEAN_000202800 [Angomonas deanei]|uniref:C3H1-type domain-containing protein n=1 Tax=Angomonas deanei TaxID=59799 RepID=A0A7G2C6Z7_9TRYP|nr:hypothetical protein ADEAN_000202800 [Angomonas deanei]
MTGGGEDRLLPLLPSNRGGGPQPVGVPPAFPEMDFIAAAPPAAADPVMNISKVLAPYVEDDKPVTHEILYRYRTEWCQDYFIYGQCPDGAHCQKAHHTSELRSEGRNREDFKMLVAAYLRAHETNMGQLRQDVGLE